MTRHQLLITAALFASPLTARAQTTAAPLLACFVPKSGTMYVVGQPGAPDKCRTTDHVLLQWNTVGPAGPTGAAGAPGPVGPQGPAGTATLAGSTAITGVETVVATHLLGGRTANVSLYLATECPEGKSAIGGGLLGYESGVASVPNFNTGQAMSLAPQLVGSYPNAAFGFSTREWIVQIILPLYLNYTTFPIVKTVAICAKVN
jgi:hypothetical protein